MLFITWTFFESPVVVPPWMDFYKEVDISLSKAGVGWPSIHAAPRLSACIVLSVLKRHTRLNITSLLLLQIIGRGDVAGSLDSERGVK